MNVIIGCSGAGGAIARRLHAAGKRVHLVGRRPDALAALSAACGGAPTTVVDVLDVPAYEEALRALCGGGPGTLAGLVYAVGSIPLKPLRATSAGDFLDAFRLNTLGAALALKHLAPGLAGGGSAGGAPGSAVLFSTVAAGTGFPNHAAIAAAKAGVEGLARSAAAELAPRVRVNVIAPSLTDTPLAARLTSSEATRKALGDAHPLPRLGSVDDLASAACWLLDDGASGWVTGQVLPVDGGRSSLRHKN
jgi:NAD(P)-dependent dehydrogenase (short-subunit alcohol dehydrogenase family)